MRSGSDFSFFLKMMPAFLLNMFMQLVVTYSYDHNKYNEVYRPNMVLTNFEAMTLESYLETLPHETPRILDVGCGAGVPFDSFLLANGCAVTGVDVSHAQIERAKLQFPSANYIHSNFLWYHDDSQYDGIILLYSLFHIYRKYHPFVMKKVHDLLLPHGKVLLNIRKEDCGDVKYRKNFCGRPMCWSHYNYRKFIRIIEQVGFTYDILGDEKAYGSKESHLWLILSKK